MMQRSFNSLSAKEVLALAMDIEKNNAERFDSLANIYENYNKKLYHFFIELKYEELDHLILLDARWKEEFGAEPKPVINEMEINGVIEAVELNHGEHNLFDDITEEDALQIALKAERTARNFYLQAADLVEEDELRRIFLMLAEFENSHVEKLNSSDIMIRR